MLFLQALLLLGAPAALAETITKTATSIRTDFCRTILTPTNNGPVPTNTRKTTVTWPFPDHSTSTSTSTKTITPEVCTQTETSFSTKRYYTTATQKVDTVSTTTTVYTVSVITKTNTETATTSTTGPAVTVTNTISAPQGFLPVADTTARTYPHRKRHLFKPEDFPPTHNIGPRGVLSPLKEGVDYEIFKPASEQAAKSVICNEIDVVKLTIITVVAAKKPYTKTLPGKTSSTTTIITETATETVYPEDAETTLTFTKTSTIATISTTITTTTTSTLTTRPTATIDAYAQCNTNNILGPTLPNGNIITASAKISPVEVSTLRVPSAHDCCVVCANTPGCTSSLFDGVVGQCYVSTPPGKGDTCPAGQSSNLAAYLSGAGAVGKYSVSNGVCGYVFDLAGSVAQ